MTKIEPIPKDKLVCYVSFFLSSAFYFYLIKAPFWMNVVLPLAISVIFTAKVYSQSGKQSLSKEQMLKLDTCKFIVFSVVLVCPILMYPFSDVMLGIPCFAFTAVYVLYPWAKRWRSLGATFRDVTFPAVILGVLLWFSNKWATPMALSIWLGWASYWSKENKKDKIQ